MTTIFLIRHAENDFVKKGRLAGRLPEVHLNENGFHQAHILAEELSNIPFKAVYSSPLERAVETANPIAEAQQLEVIIRQGLNEIDFGDWQNNTLKSLKRRKLWRVVQSTPSRVQFPDGESFADAQSRIVHELESLSALHGDKESILCVSHSDIIKLAIAYFAGMHIDMFQRIIISPASISTIQISAEDCKLVRINYEISFTIPK
jgi:probable phosphoglycerate mutase